MEFNPKKTILLSVYVIVGLWTTYTFFKANKTDEVVFSIGAGTEEIRFIKNLVNKFEAENPAIKVKLNVLPVPTDQQHHYYLTTSPCEKVLNLIVYNLFILTKTN